MTMRHLNKLRVIEFTPLASSPRCEFLQLVLFSGLVQPGRRRRLAWNTQTGKATPCRTLPQARCFASGPAACTNPLFELKTSPLDRKYLAPPLLTKEFYCDTITSD